MEINNEPATVAAVLEHQTGPSRGTGTWLSARELDIYLTISRHLKVSDRERGEGWGKLVASLRRAGESYEIEAPEGQPLWINGSLVTSRQLENGDMIEFGDSGPLSRFRLFREDSPVRKTIADMVGDCAAYMRTSRQPLPRRLFRAAGSLLRQLTVETTILFRLSVLIAMAALSTVVYQQYLLNAQLTQNLANSAARVESIAAEVTRSNEEALHPGDLAVLRSEIAQSVTSNEKRLAALEMQSHASRQVIADAAPSVAFLQGAYGYRERSSGRMLRRAVSDQGVPKVKPNGKPALTFEGDGPVVEIPYTGSGFFIVGGVLVTNRHVAVPWESNSSAGALRSGSPEPVMTKLIAYLPGRPEAIPLTLLLASDNADLALLRPDGAVDEIPGLRLAGTAPAAGDEVIVMGYPTGLRALLAQTGPAFIAELQKTGITGFWSIAERLARDGDIAALASRGIVAKTTSQALVYDADTTYGGSGGPVLDMAGGVVAVNAAILKDYVGSNFGVPADRVRELLDKAGLN